MCKGTGRRGRGSRSRQGTVPSRDDVSSRHGTTFHIQYSAQWHMADVFFSLMESRWMSRNDSHACRIRSIVKYGTRSHTGHMTSPTYAGLVLAAGRSRRMGSPKPLLDLDGRTFLRAAIDILHEGGCTPVVAVVPDDAEVAAEARAAGAIAVRGRPNAEQVDSLRAGLERLPEDARGVIVLPVDHPLVRADTIRALIEAAARESDAIVRPVHGDRAGHPTCFPRATWPALRDPGLPRGARSVVEADGIRTVDVAVDDPGIVADLDTPDAYRRHVGGTP